MARAARARNGTAADLVVAESVVPRAEGVATPARGRLGDGVLVQGTIVGRVLGLRLLSLEARVALVPAAVPPPVPAPGRARVGRELARVRRELDRPPAARGAQRIGR